MKRGSQSFSYYELLDICAKPGCPICHLGHISASRHLRSLIYDGVNDIDLRATLRDSLGYCHEHAWQLPEAGESAPLGIAILHRDILNTVRQRLQKVQYNKSRRRSLKSAVAEALNGGAAGSADERASSRYLPVEALCPACERRNEAENLAFKSLMDALAKEDSAMIAALSNSDGLCLAHLRIALDKAKNPQVFDTIIDITQEQLSAQIVDLDEFIRKNDHRFRDEKMSDSERTSWRKGLQRVVGPQNSD